MKLIIDHTNLTLSNKPHSFWQLGLILLAFLLSTSSPAQPDNFQPSSSDSQNNSLTTDKNPEGDKPTNTIHIANGEWPPYLSEELDGYGPVSQLVTEAFAISGITVKYSFMPWKRGYEDSSRDLMDGTLLWSKSPEREKLFTYSDPIMNLRDVLFYPANEPFDWHKREDLYGKVIGGAIGYHYTLEAEHQQKLLTLERVRKPESNYLKLLSGRLDLVVENDAVGFGIIRELGLTGQILAHPKPVKIKTYHLIIGNQNVHKKYFLNKFNYGLATLKANGRYDQIMDSIAKARASIHPSLQEISTKENQSNNSKP